MKKDPVQFRRIAESIAYIRCHYREQPSLDVLAAQAGLSPSHFQRLFTEWTGVSPKKFLQYTSLSHARRLLSSGRATLFDAAFETGLSGTGRLHDLFVRIEGMTPGEYKNGGARLSIRYHFDQTLFGPILTASTGAGICFMGFADDREKTLMELKAVFPRADYEEKDDGLQREALEAFFGEKPTQILLHVRGTSFQLKVWEALLTIPEGSLTTYGELARRVDNPKGSRAVGSAVGENPVSLLIPCHRVIRAEGGLGGYHWGPDRKATLIAWEKARCADTIRDDSLVGTPE